VADLFNHFGRPRPRAAPGAIAARLHARLPSADAAPGD
jgi:hypothetical protein